MNLREQIAHALRDAEPHGDREAFGVHEEPLSYYEPYSDAVLAAVAPELDRLRAKVAALQERQARVERLARVQATARAMEHQGDEAFKWLDVLAIIRGSGESPA